MGSNKSNHRIQKEKYPLPDTIDGLCSLIREILTAGSVQKIDIALDRPIRVERLVEILDSEMADPGMDLDGALRQIDLIEYYSEGATPFQIVFDMNHLIQRNGLHSVCWVTGTNNENLLSQWFELEDRGMPEGVNQLLGKPVRRLKTIPEDTLILCGSKYLDADPEDFSLAIKAAIEIRRSDGRPSREAYDQSRLDSEKRPSAAGQLALTGSKLRRVGGNGTGKLGE